jgi:hypothetical protein
MTRAREEWPAGLAGARGWMGPGLGGLAGGGAGPRMGPGDPLAVQAGPAEGDLGMTRSLLAAEVPACLQNVGLGVDQAPLRARHPA